MNILPCPTEYPAFVEKQKHMNTCVFFMSDACVCLIPPFSVYSHGGYELKAGFSSLTAHLLSGRPQTPPPAAACQGVWPH